MISNQILRSTIDGIKGIAKVDISVYSIDGHALASTYDDDDEYSRQQYLDSIYGSRDMESQVLDDIEVTTDDHIITLSTCIYGEPEHRYLVVAKLMDDPDDTDKE